MNRSSIGSWTTVLLVATFLAFTGCKGEAPAADDKGTAKADPTTAAQGEPAAADKAVEEAPDKDKAPAKVEGTKPEAAPVKAGEAPTDKATLAKAYVEIYCAQRKKETERLLEIYTRYGFADPKSWTASWTEAAKDDAWVAEITQKAIQTCP